MNEKLKVVFATPDKGRQAKSGVWSSEWGLEEKPTKDRLLAEHYLDGVYINNEKTKLGGKIRPISRLHLDLAEWFLKNIKEEN